MKSSWIERLTGVSWPYTGVVFWEMLATAVLLVAIFWPNMSVPNMLKGGLVAGLFAVLGFIRYVTITTSGRS